MKIGDVVHVRSINDWWIGKVVEISEDYEGMPYTKPIYTINEIGGPGHCLLYDKEVESRDGEYWERE